MGVRLIRRPSAFELRVVAAAGGARRHDEARGKQAVGPAAVSTAAGAAGCAARYSGDSAEDLVVGIGGALGSIARYGLNRLVEQWNVSTTFPVGIFAINVAGSVAIGVVSGLVISGRWPLSTEARTFVVVGLLGGFTTFSSFSLDTLTLMRDGHPGQALWNVVGQVGLSLLGVWLGYRFFAR